HPVLWLQIPGIDSGAGFDATEKVGEAQASETCLWIRPGSRHAGNRVYTLRANQAGSGLESLRDPPIVSSFVKHEPGPAALTGQE
ncbi:hypothetical protein, partial [Gluconobacter wancherniae]|uniref:hypothetical protein n=1 Tax=Gluconobacter wancherniae TaxID=1307955 RepID=UPI001B8B0D52